MHTSDKVQGFYFFLSFEKLYPSLILLFILKQSLLYLRSLRLRVRLQNLMGRW